MKTAHLREGIMQAVFTACACISILAVVLHLRYLCIQRLCLHIGFG